MGGPHHPPIYLTRVEKPLESRCISPTGAGPHTACEAAGACGPHVPGEDAAVHATHRNCWQLLRCHLCGSHSETRNHWPFMALILSSRKFSPHLLSLQVVARTHYSALFWPSRPSAHALSSPQRGGSPQPLPVFSPRGQRNSHRPERTGLPAPGGGPALALQEADSHWEPLLSTWPGKFPLKCFCNSGLVPENPRITDLLE